MGGDFNGKRPAGAKKAPEGPPAAALIPFCTGCGRFFSQQGVDDAPALTDRAPLCPHFSFLSQDKPRAGGS